MVYFNKDSTINAILSMGMRSGQIFMDSIETEKLSAGFYFGSQLLASSHNFINNYFALIYVINGEGRFLDHDGKRHYLAPGSLMLRHPGKTHSLDRTSYDDWFEFACAVPTSLYKALTKAGIIDDNCYYLEPGLSHDLIKKAQHYVESFSSLGGIGLVYSDFIALYTSFVESSRFHLSNEGSYAKDDWVEKARKFLSDFSDRSESIPAIAKKLGIGYESFRKQFKAIVGVSPQQYRILHTLDKADALLQQTDMLVKEIALSLGYNDAADFIRQYRKFRHLSPTQQRRR